VFTFLLFVGSVGSVFADPPEEPQAPPIQEGFVEPPGVEAIASGLAAIKAAEAEREEALQTPSAVQEREDSAFAFSGIGAEEAAELLSADFADQLAGLNADPARFLTDVTLDQPFGEFGARITDADSETELIESSVPVRTEDANGELKKVDLELEGDSNGFEPQNALTELRIDRSAEEGIEVGERNLSITQASPNSESTGRAFGNKNIFFPEVAPDTDLLVSPTAGGVELFDLLRSAESPESLRFQLDIPAEAELRPDGNGGAEVVEGESSLAQIPMPSAVDAQGTHVPVDLEVEGDAIVVDVPREENQFAYPILVDPQWITDSFSWSSGNNLDGLKEDVWHWSTSSESKFAHSTYCINSCFGGVQRGLYISTKNVNYNANEYGQWWYEAPGQTTYIPSIYPTTSAYISPFNRDNHGCSWEKYKQPHDYDGVWDGSKWTWLETDRAQWYGNDSIYTKGKLLIIGMGAGGGINIPCWRDVRAGGVTVALADPEAPTIDWVSGTSSKWTKDLTITAHTSDPGLGVKGITLSPEGASPYTSGSCTGLYADRCLSSKEASFGVSYFLEGERSASISAYDPLGPDEKTHVSSTYKWTTKIDRGKPEVELEGQLTEAIEEAEDEGEVSKKEVPQLSLPVYNLKIEAEDGSNAEAKTKRSGMKDIAVFLDGEEMEVPWKAQECPNSSCTMTETYPLRLNGLEGGPVHHLKVIAEDQVGNKREREIEFEYIPATGMKDDYVMQYFPLPDGEGNEEEEEFPKRPELAVNVTNGNLVYRQRDIEVPGAAIDLELERFYNSQLPAEESTEWGDGWTLAQTPKLEPEETEEEAPPATARVRRASGSLVGSVGLPTEPLAPQFDKELGATVTKEPGGGYTVEDQSGETDTSLVFDSTGKVKEETTSGYAKIEYSYEEGDLSELAVDDPASFGGVPPEDPPKGEAGGQFEAPAYFRSFGGESSGPGKLSGPAGIATDPEGNVWVADTGHSRVQEFNSEGEFISQFGADGASDGLFTSPRGIAVDAKGNIWVADAISSRIQEFNSKGEFVRKFGSYGTGNGKFNSLRGLAVDANGHVWAVNAASGKSRVQEFSSEGTYLSQFGTSGTADGQLMEPEGIAIDAKGNIWVADTGNNRIEKFNSKGEYLNKFGSLGAGNGQLKSPSALVFDAEGNIWVTDAGNNRLQQFSPEGAYLAQFGSAGNKAAQFSEPHGIAIDAKGHAWVADTGNDRVQESTASEFIRRFGGEGSEGGQLADPNDAAFDSKGNLWVLDYGHNRVQKFDAEGKFLDEFGAKGTGDGLLVQPSGLAVDSEDNVWVADAGNYRIQEFNAKGEFIRKFGSKGTGNGKFTWLEDVAVDPQGRVWAVDVSSTVSRIEEFNSKGEYLAKFGSGNGSANGQFWNPRSIVADSKGNLWVADSSNYRIQEFNSKFEFVRKFGNGQGSGNGQFVEMQGLAEGPEGNIWVADSQNNRIQEFSGEGAYLGQFGTAGNNDGQLHWPQGVAVDAKGNVWVADTQNDRVQEFAASEFIRKFGGDSSGAGQISNPGGVAADSEGDVWVADTSHNRIQEFTAKGEFIRQFGSYGQSDGFFASPRGIAVDAEDNVWVVDTNNHRLQEFNSKGEFVRKFGSVGKENGQFESLEDVAIDSKGNLWTIDSDLARIQQFTPEGKFISQFGAKGIGKSELESPQGIAIDPEGNVWVANSYDELYSSRIEEFTAKGEFIRSVGSQGTGNGQFKYPTDLSFDSEGNLWVADTTNDRIQVFSSEGTYLDKLATPGAGDGQLDSPQAIDIDGQGNVWIADGGNDRIERWQIPRFAMKHDSIYLSSLGEGGSGDGQLEHPGDVALDSEGNVWVADEENNRIAEFDPAGDFIQVFGQTGSANGYLNRPASLAVDANGDILVADAGNSRIQKFDPEGKYLSKFGSYGGAAGQLREPEGVAVDSNGNIWVSDTYNGRLQEFDAEGKFIRVAGSYGFDPGQLGEPTAIDIGPGGKVWVADWLGDRVVEFSEKGKFIRQFGTEGTANGQFRHPDALAIDDRGQLWVADEGGDRVQAFTEEGEYVAQLGVKGTGEGQFEFGYPIGMTTDSKGKLWIADSGNDRVQRWGLYNYVPADEAWVIDNDPKVEIETTSGLVESVEGEQAGETSYAHEGELLTAVEGPQGETEYEYDSEGRMTKVTLPNGTWGNVSYNELDGRVKSVTVDPAGAEPAKTTTFAYQDSPSRRTTVSPEGERATIYDIAPDGSVLKWWNTKVPPEIENLSGSLYANRETAKAIEPGDYELLIKAYSVEGIASIEVIANGSIQVDEKTCEKTAEENCRTVEDPWVTNTGNWAPGILNLEVVVTDAEGNAESAKFWVNIPYTPPPDPEAEDGEPPTFEEVLHFREEYGLDLDLKGDELAINERIFNLINDWYNPNTPAGEVARATRDRWSVPLRPSDVAELEYEEQYIAQDAPIISEWGTHNAPSTYAGYYIDRRQGGIIHVGFTENQTTAVEALKQEEGLLATDKIKLFSTQPSHSLASLQWVAKDFDQKATSKPEIWSVLSTSRIDVEGNTVAVGATDPTSVNTYISSTYGSTSSIYAYFATKGSPRDTCYSEYHPRRARKISGDIYAGDWINAPTETSCGCTLAFGAWGTKPNPNGSGVIKKNYALTAGHCFAQGQRVQQAGFKVNSEGKRVADWGPIMGGVTRWSYGITESGFETDAEAILLNGSTNVPRLISWKKGLVTINGAKKWVPKMTLCLAGAYGGSRCAPTEAELVKEYWENGYTWFIVVKAYSECGDSGGPIWDPTSGAAVALLAGGPTGCRGGPTWVTPLLPLEGRSYTQEVEPGTSPGALYAPEMRSPSPLNIVDG